MFFFVYTLLFLTSCVVFKVRLRPASSTLSGRGFRACGAFRLSSALSPHFARALISTASSIFIGLQLRVCEICFAAVLDPSRLPPPSKTFRFTGWFLVSALPEVSLKLSPILQNDTVFQSSFSSQTCRTDDIFCHPAILSDSSSVLVSLSLTLFLHRFCFRFFDARPRIRPRICLVISP